MKTMKQTVMFLALALTAGATLSAPYVEQPNGRRYEGTALLAAKAPPQSESGVAAPRPVERLKWFSPNAESGWKEIIESSKRRSLQSRMQDELEEMETYRMRLLWLTMALWIGGFVIFIIGMWRLLFNRKTACIMPFLICCIFVTYAVLIEQNFRVFEMVGQLMGNENANPGPTQAEGLLETFGSRYMPNAYAQYQESRAKALELEQTVQETFPQGEASDSTGGMMFAKANKKLAEAVAWTFRRRDELCFFLLFHQAGIFSENVLAKYDSRPIIIQLERESPAWPDDTPKADTALSAEDATFAAKYLPETHAGYQRLCNLFDEGAKQYADLRRTALALGAPRARYELLMLKTRLEEIQSVLQQYQEDISVQRLEHASGDATVEDLATLDHAAALQITEYEREMGVKVYVARAAKRLFMTLPGGAVMEMVWCPPGSFMMGSNDGDSDERPVHEVTLSKGFWMAKTEVTQAQWQSVMGNNSSDHKGDNLPVENVSWDDCQQFCRTTGLSLPTEAEWEYACWAGSIWMYGGSGILEDMGWYGNNSHGETRPVGQKQPNAWGLYDMHGNVWEWCADWHGEYPSGAVTDPWGESSGRFRVLRGGSCKSSAWDCRCEHRFGVPPAHLDSTIGFRPVFRFAKAKAAEAELQEQVAAEEVRQQAVAWDKAMEKEVERANGGRDTGDRWQEGLNLVSPVMDYARVMDSEARVAMINKIMTGTASNGAQLVVVSLPSLQDKDIDDFANKLFNQWGIGEQGKDNGVLLLLALEEHSVRIEVGNGYGDVLADALCERIMDERIVPHCRKGDYAAALNDGAKALLKVMAGASFANNGGKSGKTGF